MTPKLNISNFYRSIWLTMAVFFVFSGVFVIYVFSEKQIDKANEMRLQSQLLADELRQSSDDLTRMVRTYISTGNDVYKKHYQEILDIRNGIVARPIQYNDIYWDLVLDDSQRPRKMGTQKIALLGLMQQAGFTDEEFSQLSLAKANSDRLTNTEFQAMHLIESTNPISKENQAQATLMLNDAAYHQAKSEIMRPISEFYHMMEQRTQAQVEHAKRIATITRLIFITFGLLLVLVLLRTYRALGESLGASVDQLYVNIAKIGSGDFSSPIVVARGMENTIMGWLSETQIKLFKIDIERSDAETRSKRQTQLYVALSQCNQAIVRSADPQALFIKICRDIVEFGGMKMAWIGLLDAEQDIFKPTACYGNGTDHLGKLALNFDTDAFKQSHPIMVAMRENRPYWCANYLKDPATRDWHHIAREYGLGAAAFIPLHCNGKIIGTFNIYAEDEIVFDHDGQVLLVEMATDIDFALDHFKIESEREHYRLRLIESEEASRLMLENSLDAIINMDDHGMVAEWSGVAETMFGYTREEAVGKTLASLIIPPQMREAHNKGMQRLLETNESHILGKRIEVNAMRSGGGEFPIEMSIAQIYVGGHRLFSAFIRDISERKEAEQRIQHLAHFDALTGLPNRTQLDDHLNYALSLVKRNNGKLALMFLDIDHFKNINDTLGHSIGDLLLIELAKRLQGAVREEDTLSRLGGDEFIVMLPGADARGAEHVSQKLLDVISQPYQIEQLELTVTGSIGIALYPDDGMDLETLSRNADAAMYRVKHEGRNGYCFFTAEMQAHSTRNLQLLNALRHALEEKQLFVHYQPQLSMLDGRVIGAEALLRWQHPELGLVSPAEFIPVAEDNGLILSIGEWVLRQAVQQAKSWMEQGLAPLVMSVNLSAVQFRHADLPDLVSRILNEIGLPPEYLELELTESVAMHDPQIAIAVMNNLHERGVRMSIDDFGTGYSSLSYLKKFKVYKLKIDQSFVRDIITDPEDKAIVGAIINMARSLGLQTIAEGVETAGQLAFLSDQGCDEVQGYYYSKPLAAHEFEAFLINNRRVGMASKALLS